MNPQILNNALSTIGKAVAKNGPKIAKYVVVAVIGALIGSKYKDKVYKKLIKKHDKETAERLSKEFDQKLEVIKKEYKDKDIKLNELKQKISDLCREYGIAPKNVVK